MQTLEDSDIEARIAQITQGGGVASPSSPDPSPKRVRPLIDAADSLVEALRVPNGIGLGLMEIDTYTRGFRPGDLVIVTGFAHSGKTQLTNTMILNNPEKLILFFSLDDPKEMILAKLVSMYTDVPAELLEQKVRQGDEGAIALIREIATDKFPNLYVVDESVDVKTMRKAYDECVDNYGVPDCIIIDYLEMIPGALEGEGENIKKCANKLKRWARTLPCPLVTLHQGTRSNAKLGRPITLLSMGHSGEQQATIVLGCRRKKDNDDLDEDDRLRAADTITVHVVKNKRPGAKCTGPEGIDFHMAWQTGKITPLTRDQENRSNGLPPSPAAVVRQMQDRDFTDREML